MTLTRTPSQIVSDAEVSGKPGLLGKHPSWERVALGDVADVLNGAPFSSNYFNTEGSGLPLIRIRDVGVNSPTTHYSGAYGLEYIIKSGDTLVGMDGDFRVAEWRGSEGLLNQRVCKVAIYNENFYSSRFLCLVLQGYLDAIWSETSSITVKHLSSRSIAEIPLPLPPIAEQRRIVAALESRLSRVDVGDSQVFLVKQKLGTLERSMLDQIITDNSGDWPIIQVSTMAKITSGATPLKSRSDYYEGGDIPWVASSQLNDRLVTTVERLITKKALDETAVKLLPAGSLLVAMYGEGKTRGKCSELSFPATTNQACAAIVLDSKYKEYRPWVKIFFEANY